jgi:hypothetical protein
MVQKMLKSMKNWASYALESEEGDLQKLNITIQFVFFNLNSLYIAPLPLTFQKKI